MYARTKQSFIGHSVAEWCEAQRSGIATISVEDFARAAEGKAEKWAYGLRSISLKLLLLLLNED